MKLSPSHQSALLHTWSSAFNCKPIDLLTPRVLLSKVTEEWAEGPKIHVLEYRDGGTIISIPDNMRARVADKMSGILQSQVEPMLEATYGKPLREYRVITGCTPLPISESMNLVGGREILSTEKYLMDKFFSECLQEDIKKVDMNIGNPRHIFFGVFEGDEIASLGNYQTEDENDQIAHIGIITRQNSRGKGYARQVVSALLTDIFAKGLLPHWRYYPSNLASQALFQEFGFEEVLRSYTLVYDLCE